MGYSYYDTPDGEDCTKKLGYMLKKAGAYGLFTSTVYVTLVETPPGYFQTLARFARITGPFLAAAAAGTISVCLITNYRQKDEMKNHAIGGFIAGVAGGLAKGHFGHGVGAGILFAFLASGFKEGQLRNYRVEQVIEPHIQYEDFWTKDYDLTLVRKLPKDWIAK